MADDPCEAAFTGADPTGPRKFYRARYYDPKIGRFISEDPIRFGGGINFYSYVSNNPTNRTDPSGLQACCSGNASGLECYSRCVNKFLLNPAAFAASAAATAMVNALANAPSGAGKLTDAENTGAIVTTLMASRLGMLTSIQAALQAARTGAAIGGAVATGATIATAAAATVGSGVVLGCALACTY